MAVRWKRNKDGSGMAYRWIRGRAVQMKGTGEGPFNRCGHRASMGRLRGA
jgi:hypothetical protein